MPIPGPSASLKARSHIGKTNSNIPAHVQSSQPPPQDATAGEEASDAEFLERRPSIARPLSFHGDVEGSKRRSLLPQPGQSRYNTRSSLLPGVLSRSSENQEPVENSLMATEQQISASSTEDIKISGARAPRLRPRSMYQTSATSPERAHHIEEAPASRLMRPPAPVNKSSEPQISGLGRSQSLRKPAITTQPTHPTAAVSHSRARSINTTTSSQAATARSIVAPEKPKSLPIAPSSNVRAHSGSVDAVPRGTRMSARLLGSNRSASIKVGSEVLNAGNAKVAPKPEQSSTSQLRRREPVQEETKRTTRPAFSTLQQHFTPRKVGKAPTATFLHPPPASGTSSLPPDVINLQAELLQLHMLHEGSAQVSRYWELSAKRNLHNKFEEIASLYQAMLEEERKGLEQRNLQSLLEWSTENASTGLIEHIQILSEPLHELPVLLGSGGRLHNLVADFDVWISRAQAIQSARQGPIRGHDVGGAIESLGDSWQAENAAVTRKLTALARDLDNLGPPSAGSTIAYIVETCRLLLGGILDELRIMQTIESVVVAKEREWVEDRLQSIARDIGAHMEDTRGETSLWQS